MSSLFAIAIILGVVALGAAGFYLYSRSQGDNPLFAPKERRLAYVERASIDAGRKLVLIRRDNVEHLLLIGGPIDLVIETGIPAEPVGRRDAAENAYAGAVRSYADTARTWHRGARNGGADPIHSLAVDRNADDDALELSPAQETTLAK